MKPKDAGFFQLHIEKLILGGAVIFLLVIAALYFVGNPYAVTVQGAKVAPGAAPGKVLEHAAILDRKLKSQEREIPEVNIANYEANFKSRGLQMPLSVARFAMPLGNPGMPGVIVEPPDPYVLPSPPMPAEITARASYAVLDELAKEHAAEVVFVPILNRRPHDFRYVSVSAEWDLDTWIERLEAPQENPVPRNWWQSALEIGAVQLHRQEMDPVTGRWQAPTVIPVLPDQIAYFPPAADDPVEPWKQEEAEQAVRRIKEQQELVVRPRFPSLADRSIWLPPDSKIRSLTPEKHQQLDKLRGKIENRVKRIENIQKQLEKQQRRLQNENRRNRQQPQRNTRQRRASGGGAMGGGAMMGGGMGGGLPDMSGGGVSGGSSRRRRGSGNRGGGGVVNAAQNRSQEMTEQLRMLHEELIQLEIERDEMLGIEPDVVKQRDRSMPFAGGMGMGMGGAMGMGAGGAMGMGGPMGMGGALPGGMGGALGEMDPRYSQGLGGRFGRYSDGDDSEQMQEEQGRRTIKVWAHDLTVKTGKTYRYQVVVCVLNPLFRQSRVEQQQREQNYHRLVLGPDPTELEATEWSEPVTVDPEHHFFLVGGNPDQGVGKVEVWRIFNGMWQHDEFRVSPGDPIGGTMAADFDGQPFELDLHVKSLVVDLASAGGQAGSDVGMYFLSPESNKLDFKTVSEDADSPIRKRLQNESEIIRQLTEMPGLKAAVQ